MNMLVGSHKKQRKPTPFQWGGRVRYDFFSTPKTVRKWGGPKSIDHHFLWPFGVYSIHFYPKSDVSDLPHWPLKHGEHLFGPHWLVAMFINQGNLNSRRCDLCGLYCTHRPKFVGEVPPAYIPSSVEFRGRLR